MAWKQANVTPLPKEKLVRDINEHLRPISPTFAISKQAEDFVVEQYVFPAVMEVINPHQFGGISHSSATYALRQMNDRQALYSAPSGAQNRFLSTGLDDHSPLLRYIQALTFLITKNRINHY